MAVLEEDPPPAVHSLLHHALSYGSLRWEEERMGEGRAGKAKGKGEDRRTEMYDKLQMLYKDSI